MRKSRLSKVKQDELLQHFVSGSTARVAAALVEVNKNTACYYFHRLRELIAAHIEKLSDEYFTEKIEIDESYLGGVGKGKQGRGGAGKIPVFGLLKRGGKVFTKRIANAATSLPIIREKVVPDSIVHTDSFKSYNVLDVSEFKDYRINHSKLFAAKTVKTTN